MTIGAGMQSGFAEINGTRLYYEVAGSGPPVVLVHGFSLDTRMWDGQFERFAERYRVIRYDLRGFGQSALPESGFHYRHADDLNALLEHLDARDVAVVGLSLGGAVSQDFARAYPDSLRALVLVDSILPGFETPELAKDIGRIWGTAREQGVEAAKPVWIGCGFFDVVRERPEVLARLEEMITSYSGWGWTARDPGTWFDPPSAQELEHIAAPALVVVGERDVPDMQRIAGELAGRIPNARKVVLPGLGHMPNMEDAEAFNAVVLDFLAEHDPA